MNDTVGSVMTRGVIRVSPHMSVDDAVQIMRKNGVSGVPVLEDGLLVGVLSHADLAKLVLHPNPRTLSTGSYPKAGENAEHSGAAQPPSLKVSDIMTPIALALTPEVSLREAAAAMVKHDIHRLIVVETDGSLAGILSPLDILGHLSR